MKKNICIFLCLAFCFLFLSTNMPMISASGNIFDIPGQVSGNVLAVKVNAPSKMYKGVLYIDGMKTFDFPTVLSGGTLSKNVNISGMKTGRHIATFIANTNSGIISSEKVFYINKSGVPTISNVAYLSEGVEISESSWTDNKPIPAREGYKFTFSNDFSGEVKLFYLENGKRILLDTEVTRAGNTVTIKTPRTPFGNTLYIAEFGENIQYAFETGESEDVTVYKNLDFEKEIGVTYYSSQVSSALGEVIERTTVDGNGVLRSAMGSAGDGFFSQINLETIGNEDNYVVDFKINISKLSGSASIGLLEGKDAAGNFRYGFKINSTGVINQVEDSTPLNNRLSYTFSKNMWYRIVIVYNIVSGRYNLYIYNGNSCIYTKENYSVVGALRPEFFKIELMKSGEVDVKIDDFRVYSGSKKQDSFADMSSIMEKSADAQKTIGSACVFSVDSDNYYIANKKFKYQSEAEKPVEIDGIPYISSEFASNVLLASDTVHTDRIKVGNSAFALGSYGGVIDLNGKLYLRANTAATVLGKQYTYDDRGYFIFSDDVFSATNSKDIASIMDSSDGFYRYIMMENPRGEEVVADFKNGGLYGVHPRILFTNNEIEWLKNLSESGDKEVQDEIQKAINMADKNLTWSRLTANDADDKKQSRAASAQNVITYHATAYLLTGDERYAMAGIRVLDAAAAWSNLAWKTSNLITGHWSALMAIGYDSFYNYLNATEEGRVKLQTYRNAIENLAFADTITSYSGGYGPHWITIADNFSGVIGGGMLALSMAVADEPQFKNTIPFLLENIIKTNELSAVLYYNDGAYFEGVTYSEYMLTNLSMGMEALFKACGSDYGISNARGFKKAGDMFAYLNTPSQSFDYSDCEPQATNSFVPFWFGYRYGETDSAELNMKRMRLDGIDNECIRTIFYYKKMIEKYGEADVQNVSLDKYFPKTLTGSFRNSFDEKYPIAAFYHLAKNGTTHDHLDAGQWEFEANGVKWAMDLGPDEYNLTNYFSNEGYQIYRKNPQGHNLVLINPSNSSSDYYGQNLKGESTLLSYQSKKNEASALFDLTDVYSRDVENYTRGFHFGDNRTTFTVTDEIELSSIGSEIYWFMHTEANINIVDKNTAILTKGGKSLRVEIDCSASDYEVLNMQSKPLSGTSVISGKTETTRKLAIHIPSSSENETISVRLIPYGFAMNIDNGSANVSITIPATDNYNFISPKPKLIVVFYGDDERICDVKVQPLDLSNGKVDYTDSFAVPSKAKTVKAMLWDEISPKENAITETINN